MPDNDQPLDYLKVMRAYARPVTKHANNLSRLLAKVPETDIPKRLIIDLIRVVQATTEQHEQMDSAYSKQMVLVTD